MTDKVIDITGTDVAHIIAQGGTVLYDLWSPTCAPCRMLAPVLDDLAVDFAGEVKICKADVSADTALAAHFGARALPTLALYQEGKEVDRLVGMQSRSRLMTWLESHL